MSILKNILGAFVEFKDDKGNQSNVLLPTRNPASKPAAPLPPVPSQNTSSAPPASSSSYSKHFEDVVEAANAGNPLFNGTDFKEFVDSKADLDAISDEPTKYRTAFNVLKRTGLTKERLLSTGQEYIKVIQQDLDAFESAYTQQYKTDVENKEGLLQQKAQELQALTDKIETLNKEIKELNSGVSQSKERLGTNRAAFMQAGENKKREIKDELEKIQQYF